MGEVASFHSLSKGFLGECGVRGGYVAFENFDPEIMQQMIKLKSIELCSNTVGQLSVGLMVRPPTGSAAALYETNLKALKESPEARREMATRYKEVMRTLPPI